jgi:hypothetical protein
MAQTGLHYADDPYDEARYERMLGLVAEHYGETFAMPPRRSGSDSRPISARSPRR